MMLQVRHHDLKVLCNLRCWHHRLMPIASAGAAAPGKRLQGRSIHQRALQRRPVHAQRLQHLARDCGGLGPGNLCPRPTGSGGRSAGSDKALQILSLAGAVQGRVLQQRDRAVPRSRGGVNKRWWRWWPKASCRVRQPLSNLLQNLRRLQCQSRFFSRAVAGSTTAPNTVTNAANKTSTAAAGC